MGLEGDQGQAPGRVCHRHLIRMTRIGARPFEGSPHDLLKTARSSWPAVERPIARANAQCRKRFQNFLGQITSALAAPPDS
jgi:hypothetical protein